jgi:hypothetical protein
MADTSLSLDITAPAPSGSVAGTQLGGMLAGTQQDRSSLRAAGLSFPAELSSIRSQEKERVDALGPPPRLTPEQMQQYLGPAPKPQTQSLVEEWGSPAMIMALLGSAFTRQPLTNALNAGGAVMKAFQQRDFDGARSAAAQWKENTDTALKLYELQSKSYAADIKAIREGSGDAIKDAVANLRAMSVAYNDRPLMNLLAAGRYDLAVDREDRLAKSAAELHTKTEMINDGLTKQHGLYDATTALGTAKKALEAAQKGGDQETITAAQTAYDNAQATYQSAADDMKAWGDAQQAAKGGAKPPTRAQQTDSQLNDKARADHEALSKGESVTHNDITISPEDWAARDDAIKWGLLSQPKQHAIQDLMKRANIPQAAVGGQPAAKPGGAAPAAGAPPAKSPQETQALIAHAREAIEAGADRDAVIKKLREMGVDPSGL